MAERGELTLEEAARRLTVSKMTVLRLIAAARSRRGRSARAHPGRSPRLSWPSWMPARLSRAARNQKIPINDPLFFAQYAIVCLGTATGIVRASDGERRAGR
jgi:excisionase family DNA binding protein